MDRQVALRRVDLNVQEALKYHQVLNALCCMNQSVDNSYR